MADPREFPLGSGSVDMEPWPGGAPPGSQGAPASGQTSFRLVVDAATVPKASAAWRNVATWRSSVPTPTVLSLRVQNASGETTVYTQDTYTQGMVPPETAGPLGGSARITYGVANALRTLQVDLKPGHYQLPPCEFVSIDAAVYGVGPQSALGQATYDLLVGAGITPGRIANSARFTSTWQPYVLHGASLTEVCPLGARWVALSTADASDVATGQPKVRLRQTDGHLQLHDYATGTFLSQPGQPVELSNRKSIIVYNDAIVDVLLQVKFYLEL